MTISDKIQELRKQNSLSQEQLADKMGVSRQAVSKWESGICAPDIEKIVALSELFGVSTDYLMKGTETINSMDNPVQSMDIWHNSTMRKYAWLIAIPLGFIVCYIIWQMGQIIGEDIGEFIYYINN